MSNDAEAKLRQIPFDFKVANHMGRDDFMVSACNKEAFEMIDNWPQWLSAGLFLYGPHGCGKSHLAHLFVEKLRQTTGKPYPVSIVEARGISMKSVRRLAAENTSIVIENVSEKCDAEALFHLFNIYNQDGRYMLWTGLKAPHYIHFKLADLYSRLNMLPCVEIQEPDDVMLQTLIVKLFNDRQLLISPEILNYIMTNAERSFSYIQHLVEEIDVLSLAYQTSANYNIVKKAMDILAHQSSREPDLFADL
ncbi:MAG: hypothetical protein J6Y91_02635 [Alphaproteobacteria bacterium]|nr:hypothetical protein [Alphaproteobacteria bacterium]